MNKKQAIIIVTLLALIVCVGVLATKVNSPFSVAENTTDGTNISSNSGKSAVSFNSNDNKTSKSQFFEEARLNRIKRMQKLFRN